MRIINWWINLLFFEGSLDFDEASLVKLLLINHLPSLIRNKMICLVSSAPITSNMARGLRRDRQLALAQHALRLVSITLAQVVDYAAELVLDVVVNGQVSQLGPFRVVRLTGDRYTANDRKTLCGEHGRIHLLWQHGRLPILITFACRVRLTNGLVTSEGLSLGSKDRVVLLLRLE